MTFADVTGARAVVESGFDVQCRITRDPEGPSDDIFDPVTLQLTPPAPDSTTIYEGPSMLRPIQSGAQRTEGGAQVYIDDYRARIPVDAPTVQIGDLYTVLSAPNDPQQNTRVFTVQQVAGGSYAVSRILTLHAHTRGPRE